MDLKVLSDSHITENNEVRVEVTQADREAAWPFAHFHCLPDQQMHERWFSGYYDNLPQGSAIQAFARHRQSADAASRAEVERLREVLGDIIEDLEQGDEFAAKQTARKAVAEFFSDAAISASDGENSAFDPPSPPENQFGHNQVKEIIGA